MRNALIVFFATVVIGHPPGIPSDWPKPDVRPGLTQAQTVAAIANYAQTLAEGNHFSGVILVANGGETKLERAWGYADREAKRPNTIDTKFNIGSINKVFTQTAIHQLAAAGKLSLDDNVRKYLSDFPSPAADRITIHQLLDHRSGLGDFFGPKYAAAPPAKLRELSDFLPLFASEPLQFEPGTSQRYSNAGYIVLGLIIEKVSGEKYRDYVQKHIFDPAGMKDSGFWAVDERVANRATGYTEDGPNTATLPGRPSSAGGAYSTARDLQRFFQWKKADGIAAAGGAPGVNAMVRIDDGWTVIALSNYGPPSAEAVAEGAMKIIEAPAVVSVAVPLTNVEHLVAVDAKLNGKGPYKFVVDSGAAGKLRITEDLAKTLGLEKIGEALSGDPSGKNVERRAVYRVDSIEIGGAKFTNVPAVLSPPRGSDGVIGLGLFGDVTVTLDYPKKELRLSNDALPPTAPHVIPFTRERGIPAIDVDVAGTIVKADVDTGSPALLSVPSSLSLPFSAPLVVAGHGRTTTNEFEIKRGQVKGDLRVAGNTIANPTIDVVDLFPIANLGARFLSRCAVTFDLANERMSLDCGGE